jgi:hypothetical protein
MVNTGFANTLYTDTATAPYTAQFSADDFVLGTAARITALRAEGFFSSNVTFPDAAAALTWSIFPDAGGVPAGNPKSAAGAAVWTYTASPTGAGVDTAGGFLSLDLAAAGQSVVLPPGRYWLLVNTTGTSVNSWAQFASATGDGNFAFLGVSSAANNSWITSDTIPALDIYAGLNMRVVGEVACGAPWLGSVTPGSGSLAPGGAQSTNVTLDTSALLPASYSAFLCVNSNDPVTPSTTVKVNLTVNP